MKKAICLIIACFLLISCCCYTESKSTTFQGQLHGLVIRVLDGDTVDIWSSNDRKFRIRLFGIDAPEKGQSYGEESTDNLIKYCADKSVTAELMDVDRYSLLIAVIYCDGINANLQQIKDGVAWVYDYYTSKDNQTLVSPYYQAETTAKETKIGLWLGEEPIPPWEWRHGK